MKMAKTIIWIFLWLFSAFSPAQPYASQLESDDPWPDFLLPLPADPITRHYLGIKEGDAFTLNEIGSDVVVVEIFNMYCPFCQREAPHVNGLFKLVDGRADLGARLKIIGIGVGNSPYEVDYYRRSYSVPFPLFPDPKFDIYNELGRVRTPHFFVLKRDEQNRFRVAFIHAGGFKTPEAFLTEIIKRCGLK